MTTMEDLTKTQIILLTLLVSFITSIATGIIASSLLSAAPAGVTQTIDRVIEHTIEQVSPTPAGTTESTRVVTIVKEDDAITSAIDQGSKSIVRIKSPIGADGKQAFYALGVIVSKDGLILSDAHGLIANALYSVVLSDDSVLSAAVVAKSDSSNLVLFKMAPDFKHLSFNPVAIASNDVKLGQSVIAFEGEAKNTVAVGRVLSIDDKAQTVLTDISPTLEVSGGALLNLSGELAGLKTSNADLTLPQSVYKTLTTIKSLVAAHN